MPLILALGLASFATVCEHAASCLLPATASRHAATAGVYMQQLLLWRRLLPQLPALMAMQLGLFRAHGYHTQHTSSPGSTAPSDSQSSGCQHHHKTNPVAQFLSAARPAGPVARRETYF
jgi:hypothetical protein